MEPEKPFACTFPDCTMTFTNEDHLHVHTKKHDMMLQLDMEQKTAFVADQTPTPTRFIRNCEEVGLFQDLQNVNPFDEGFKRAMETKHGLPLLESASSAEDALHTPHLMFPLEPGDCALYTTNNQRNITISRSSSDESGAVKEYETTTISKLTNEVTTISRVVGKPDTVDRVTTTDDVSIVRHEEMALKDGVNETSVSYTNNVIKIHSNVEIRKDSNINLDRMPSIICSDTTVAEKSQEVPPIMSQRSLDFVVDSLTNSHEEKDDVKKFKRTISNTKDTARPKDKTRQLHEDFEVIIKLPNGKHVKMKAVDDNEKTINNNTKEKLKSVIFNKTTKPIHRVPSIPVVPNIVPMSSGTFIPVTFVKSMPLMEAKSLKVPIQPLPRMKTDFKSVKRKSKGSVGGSSDCRGSVGGSSDCRGSVGGSSDCRGSVGGSSDCRGSVGGSSDCRGSVGSNDKSEKDWSIEESIKSYKNDLEGRSAASKRYRERLKMSMRRQGEENKRLKEMNQQLVAEKALLKLIITDHMKKCPIGHDLDNFQDKLQQAEQYLNQVKM